MTTTNHDEPDSTAPIVPIIQPSPRSPYPTRTNYHRTQALPDTAAKLLFAPDPLQPGLWAIRHPETHPAEFAEEYR